MRHFTVVSCVSPFVIAVYVSEKDCGARSIHDAEGISLQRGCGPQHVAYVQVREEGEESVTSRQWKICLRYLYGGRSG